MRGAKLFLVLGAALAPLMALPATAQPAAAGTLTVSDAWVRAVPGATVAAEAGGAESAGQTP